MLARKARDREERIDAIFAAMRSRDPGAERFGATLFHDFERAPWTTNAEQLASIGVAVPPPGAVPDSDDEAGRVLWTTIYGLAHLGIYLINTDHLTDRRLLEVLTSRILRDTVRDSGGCSDMSEFIDLHFCPAVEPVENNAGSPGAGAASSGGGQEANSGHPVVALDAMTGAAAAAHGLSSSPPAEVGSSQSTAITSPTAMGVEASCALGAKDAERPDGLTGPYEHADEDDDEAAPWDQGRAKSPGSASAGVGSVDTTLPSEAEMAAMFGKNWSDDHDPCAVCLRDRLLPLPKAGRI